MTVSSEGLRPAAPCTCDIGSIELHIAKLAPDHRFIVGTPDSEVEVRGTRFTVGVVPADPGCGAGVRTRVAVTEGVVVARRHSGIEDRIAVGEQWPSGCIHAAADAPGMTIKQAAGVAAVVAPSTGSSLADQNDLFAVAAAAKRRGDARGALAALDRFLALYPASPLAESASVERMRVRQPLRSPRAPASARDYHARSPHGFAHGEAEAIVSEGP